MPKVGDTIYKFDENHRVYRRDKDGRAQGGPIYAEHFFPFVIQGETKHSWLTGYRGEEKVNKRTMRSAGKGGFHGHDWFTEEGKAGRIWLARHRHKIIRHLEHATEEQLRRVAEIVGYRASDDQDTSNHE